MNDVYTYECQHAFHPGIAADYDVTTALMVQHVHFWISRNKKAGVNNHDGRTWMYQTIEAMALAFPYWSKKQTERAIEKCVSNGILIKGNYNKTKYDRTCWYAFSNEVKFGISRKREKPFPKSENGRTEIGTPIPDTKTDTEEKLLPEVVVSPDSEEEKTPSATIASGERKVNTPPTEKESVVVPSFALELGADEDSYSRLAKLFSQEQIFAACEVAKSQGTRPDNFFGWIRDCIEKGWKPKASSESNAQANAKWWYENHHKKFDGKTIAYTTITTCNKYVEFVRGGAGNNTQCIEYTDPNFQARIKAIISELIDFARRHE